jgi:hypothetical protein
MKSIGIVWVNRRTISSTSLPWPTVRDTGTWLMRGFATIVATASSALCAENSARRCSFQTSFNFCSSAVELVAVA